MTTLLNKIDNDTIVKPLVTGSPATRSADSTGKTKNQVTTALPQKKAGDSIPRQKPITSLSTTFPSQKLVVTKEKQKEKVDTVVSAEIKKLPEKQVVKN